MEGLLKKEPAAPAPEKAVEKEAVVEEEAPAAEQEVEKE